MTMGMHIRDSAAICQLIETDHDMMAIIGAVAELRLPDGWIAAGFVRNRVWDVLHDYAQPTPLADIDVIYFDPVDRTKAAEKAIEAALHSSLSGLPWSVKNQARMAERNGDPPYRSTLDALGYWCETPTAVAVRLGCRRQAGAGGALGHRRPVEPDRSANAIRPRPSEEACGLPSTNGGKELARALAPPYRARPLNLRLEAQA